MFFLFTNLFAVEQTMKPDVCVYILIYNDEIYGPRAIESVINQTYKNIQIKILENGSTDATRDKIEIYRKDPRVIIYHNNINLKSEFATYIASNDDYDNISFLFSNDYYHDNRIETCLNNLENNEVLFSNNKYMNQDNKKLDYPPNYIPTVKNNVSLLSRNELLLYLLSKGTPVHPCSMFIKGNTYKKHGGFKGYYHNIGDMIFFTKIFATCQFKCLPEKLQTITVWDNKRNLGAKNRLNHEHLLFERQMVLEEFKKPYLFDQLENIFLSNQHYSHKIESRVEKLWFLAQLLLKYDALDYRLFAVRCLYEAAEINEEEINKLSSISYGCSFGTFMENLTNHTIHYTLHTKANHDGIKSFFRNLERNIRHRIRGIS